MQKKEIVIQHVGSHLHIADGLTKPLSGPKFQLFRSKLKVISHDELSLREDKSTMLLEYGSVLGRILTVKYK